MWPNWDTWNRYCCQMLMITQQSWLYLIKISMSLGYQFWQGKKGQSIFSLLCFHEALELVEVSNSILAILFKNWLWIFGSMKFFKFFTFLFDYTVRPWDTRPQAARTLTFWIGSKKIWDARIYVVKTLSCTVFCLIK